MCNIWLIFTWSFLKVHFKCPISFLTHSTKPALSPANPTAKSFPQGLCHLLLPALKAISPQLNRLFLGEKTVSSLTYLLHNTPHTQARCAVC